MNLLALVVDGLLATLVLTVWLSLSQGLGWSRISLPTLVGTMLVADRDRARAVGFLVHVANGWCFAFVYVAAFHAFGFASWWLGALGGLLHALVVLTAGMQALPGVHPRMARPAQGPTVTRHLEPPGFLALHYGRGTPLSVVVAHLLYGALLGALYPL